MIISTHLLLFPYSKSPCCLIDCWSLSFPQRWVSDRTCCQDRLQGCTRVFECPNLLGSVLRRYVGQVTNCQSISSLCPGQASCTCWPTLFFQCFQQSSFGFWGRFSLSRAQHACRRRSWGGLLGGQAVVSGYRNFLPLWIGRFWRKSQWLAHISSPWSKEWFALQLAMSPWLSQVG